MNETHESGEATYLLADDSQGGLQAHGDVSGDFWTFFGKVATTIFSFVTLGLFSSSIGALLPTILVYYSLSYLHVSLVFLAGPFTYIIASQSNAFIHQRFGRRGIAVIGSLLQVSSASLLSIDSSFNFVLLGLAIQGLALGVLDGSWCAWAGSMKKNAGLISGLLHGGYSTGAAMAPFIVTITIDSGHQWYEWYRVLLVLSIVEAVALIIAFRHETADVYKQQLRQNSTLSMAQNVKAMLRFPATWWSETAISGWIVVFVLQARHATKYLAGLTSSAYWGGMAIGRLVLGPVTDRLGVRLATHLYFTLAIIVQMVFVFIDSASVSLVLMILLGFFMGPMFPSGVIIPTQLLLKDLHVTAVSFLASLGQVGGAALPFLIGVLVDGISIFVFPYVILFELLIAAVGWACLSRLKIVHEQSEQG